MIPRACIDNPCDSGEYRNAGDECVDCPVECAECSSATACTSCDITSNFKYLPTTSGLCLTDCPAGERFNLDNECVACSNGCERCTNDDDSTRNEVCLLCQDGYSF